MLEVLEAGPHRDRTIVVLWSDHGWHLGEKQHWGKRTGWERSTRVPLLIAPAPATAERFAAGRVCRQPVGLIDLYPTLIELCGLSAQPGLDGVSLGPLLRDPDQPNNRAVATSFHDRHYTVRTAQWRYVRYQDGSEELYDHRTDPQEWVNLAGRPSYHAVKAGLAKELPANPAKPAQAKKPSAVDARQTVK